MTYPRPRRAALAAVCDLEILLDFETCRHGRGVVADLSKSTRFFFVRCLERDETVKHIEVKNKPGGSHDTYPV